MEIKKGIGVSSGIAVCQALLLSNDDLRIGRRAIPASQIDSERVRLDEALIASRVVCDTPNSSKAPESMGFAQLRQLRAISELDADYCEKLGIAKA